MKYNWNFLDQPLLPYKFHGRDMWGMYFFIVASCEPLKANKSNSKSTLFVSVAYSQRQEHRALEVRAIISNALFELLLRGLDCCATHPNVSFPRSYHSKLLYLSLENRGLVLVCWHFHADDSWSSPRFARFISFSPTVSFPPFPTPVSSPGPPSYNFKSIELPDMLEH